MAMDIESRIRERLPGSEHVPFALLFGSRGRAGRARPESDRDVAVYLDDRVAPGVRFSEQLRLARELSDLGRIDLVVLNDDPPL